MSVEAVELDVEVSVPFNLRAESFSKEWFAEWISTLLKKALLLAQERKFWVLVTSIVAAFEAKSLGALTDWGLLVTVIGALQVYSVGTALEGFKASAK